MSNSKESARIIFDEEFPLLRVLRAHFIGKAAPFAIDDLADTLGVASISLYKQFEAERPLRADTLFNTIAYVYRKQPVAGKKLLDLVFELYGIDFECRAKLPRRARAIVEAIDGNLLDLFRDSRGSRDE